MGKYEEYLTERKLIDDKYLTAMDEIGKEDLKGFTVIDRRDKLSNYWYLATVYTSYPQGLEQAYLDACKMAAHCRHNGIRVFCPIAHTHTTSKYMDLKQFDHDYWMQDDYMFLSMAQGLIVTKMDNWEASKGIKLEIDYMKERGRPIIYTDWMKVPNIGSN